MATIFAMPRQPAACGAAISARYLPANHADNPPFRAEQPADPAGLRRGNGRSRLSAPGEAGDLPGRASLPLTSLDRAEAVVPSFAADIATLQRHGGNVIASFGGYGADSAGN